MFYFRYLKMLKKIFFRHNHVYFHLNKLSLPFLIESIFKLQLIAIKNGKVSLKLYEFLTRIKKSYIAHTNYENNQ